MSVDESEVRAKCTICLKLFHDKDIAFQHYLFDHMMYDKLGREGCASCEVLFKRGESATHFNQCHYVKMWKCKRCKKTFTYKGGLTNHQCNTILPLL